MGEGARAGTLYFAADSENATPIPVGVGALTLPNDCADNAEPYPVQSLDGFSVAVKSKHIRCHSRRRLVKLLMGQGRSRNESNRIARQCRERGIPYKREWFLRFFDGGVTC